MVVEPHVALPGVQMAFRGTDGPALAVEQVARLPPVAEHDSIGRLLYLAFRVAADRRPFGVVGRVMSRQAPLVRAIPVAIHGIGALRVLDRPALDRVGRTREQLLILHVRHQDGGPSQPFAHPISPPRHVALVVVLRIHHRPEAQLAQVADACGLPRLLPGLGEDRKEDGSKNGNDSNHNEQLNQCEGSSSHRELLSITVG